MEEIIKLADSYGIRFNFRNPLEGITGPIIGIIDISYGFTESQIRELVEKEIKTNGDVLLFKKLVDKK